MIRIVVPGPKQTKRGRHTLHPDLVPWLKKMHEYVRRDDKIRPAAEIIARRYGHEIPQGTKRQRSYRSTVDLLRRHYARWAKEQDEAEARQRAMADMAAQMQRACSAISAKLNTPAMQAFTAQLDLMNQKLRKLDLGSLGFAVPEADDFFVEGIKSQKDDN
jgi:hypothetical protein